MSVGGIVYVLMLALVVVALVPLWFWGRRRCRQEDLAQQEAAARAAEIEHMWWASLSPFERQQVIWKRELAHHGVHVSDELVLSELSYHHLLGQARQRQATWGAGAMVSATVLLSRMLD